MNSRKLRWTRRALRRLDEIGAMIAKDDPAAAERVVAKLLSSVEALGLHPALGRIGRIAGTRELIITPLPYLIPYRVTPDSIEIITILHGAQRWPLEF